MQVPGIGKVREQMLTAFGIKVCRDLRDNRGLIAALFSEISCNFFLEASLGLGNTAHWDTPQRGEVGRKGISCERTFGALSKPEDLEAKVCMSLEMGEPEVLSEAANSLGKLVK